MLLPLLATLALSLGREVPSSLAPPEVSHAADAPLAASDGRDFVVIWNDIRGQRAATITADGSVLQPLGVPLPSEPAAQVIWNGTDYLLMNEDSGHALHITRMDRNLNLLDAQPKVIPAIGRIQTVAWNSSRIVMLTSSSGVLLGTDGNAIRSFPAIYPSIGAGTNGSDFIIVSAPGPGGLAITRISHEGDVLDATPRTISASAPGIDNNAQVASDGNGYLIVWRDSTGVDHTVGVNADGSPRGATINLPLPPHPTSACRLIWGGSAYILALEANPNIAWRASLDRDGNIIGSPVQRELASPALLALASNGNSVLSIVSDAFTGLVTLDEMTAQLLDGAGTPRGAPFAVTHSRPVQRRQEVAFDGNELLAVWSEATGLYMARMTADGETTSGRGVPILQKGLDKLFFRVAFDGREFVVVWNQSTNVYAQRVRGDGTFDGAPVLVAETKSPESIVDLACDGSGGCFVVWQANDHSVDGALLRGGAVDANLILQRPTTGTPGDSHVVWDGHEYIVISAKPSVDPFLCCFVVDGQRVSSDGIAIDAFEKTFSGIVDYTGQPAVAWAGDQGLLVWEEFDEPYPSPSCATFDRDLRLTSPARRFAFADRYPTVAFDGRNYIVVTTEPLPNSNPLRATVITADGEPGDPITVAANPATSDGFASVTGLGDGRSLVTYIRRDDDAVPRAFIRFLTETEVAPGRHRRVRH